MKITVHIDGRALTVQGGTNLVDVAADNGVFIPTLCYVRGRPCLGTCRTCSVKVDGAVTAACTVSVTDGMQVEVDELSVADMRKAIVESMFAEGKHNCPSCEKSGRCQLQAVGYELKLTVSRFPYRFPVRERDIGAQNLWLERDRCIFCQRCVEFVRDAHSGSKVFSISGRGKDARIEIDVELADRMSPDQVRAAADLCPVGCIIEKRRGFNDPMGQREYEIQSVRERAVERSRNE